ncbi:MAG: hypothetical protein WDN72_09715 [Alphaproteobacteria bacterium]
MSSFLLFAMPIAFLAAAFIAWPIAAHPGLPDGRNGCLPPSPRFSCWLAASHFTCGSAHRI